MKCVRCLSLYWMPYLARNYALWIRNLLTQQYWWEVGYDKIWEGFKYSQLKSTAWTSETTSSETTSSWIASATFVRFRLGLYSCSFLSLLFHGVTLLPFFLENSRTTGKDSRVLGRELFFSSCMDIWRPAWTTNIYKCKPLCWANQHSVTRNFLDIKINDEIIVYLG